MRNTVVACYRVRAGRESEFAELLRRHHPTLRRLGLATAEPAAVYRGEEDGGGAIFFEIFTWTDAAAVETAHVHPEVQALWEPMGALVEDRDSGPGMAFPHVDRLC
jgi:quinol monooxygenase YgiN